MYNTNFEEYYIKARDSEGRILSDEELRKLPHISKNNAHYKEWRFRQNSAFLVYEYLEKHHRGKLLDLGCGNGWMTNYLGELFEESLGIDVNTQEIEQAKRVFGKSNISFLSCDIFQNEGLGRFDVVVISAALQYFSDPTRLIHHLINTHLNEGGKIIIMDTFFYTDKELENAKTRSKEYYTKLNCPEMIHHYFHHTEKIFSDFKVDFVYRAKATTISDRIVNLFSNRNTNFRLSPFNIYSIQN